MFVCYHRFDVINNLSISVISRLSAWPHHPVIRGRTVPTHSRFSRRLSLGAAPRSVTVDRRGYQSSVHVAKLPICSLTHFLSRTSNVVFVIRYLSNTNKIYLHVGSLTGCHVNCKSSCDLWLWQLFMTFI